MLTSTQRAVKVLASQGKPRGKLTRMTSEEIIQLAVMCSADGVLVPDVRIRFSNWLADRCNGCGQDEKEE